LYLSRTGLRNVETNIAEVYSGKSSHIMLSAGSVVSAAEFGPYIHYTLECVRVKCPLHRNTIGAKPTDRIKILSEYGMAVISMGLTQQSSVIILRLVDPLLGKQPRKKQSYNNSC
jgi:hypothetical protein